MIPWATGDVITAEKLNRMMVEPLMCTFTQVNEGHGTLDKSYNDIRQALLAGKPIYYYYPVSEGQENYSMFIGLETGIGYETGDPYYGVEFNQTGHFYATDSDAPLSNMS